MAITRDKGMNNRVGGTKYVRKMPMPSCSPQRPVSLARAYPAGTASSRVITTTMAPTQAVFQSHLPYRVSKNSTLRCSRVGGSLKRKGLFSRVMRSLVRLKVVISIQ